MGKSSKQRDCPAAGHVITPAECGEHRGSRYACPDTCAFNPFATAKYAEFLEMEGDVDRKTLEWVKRIDPGHARRAAAVPLPSDAASTYLLHAFYLQEIFSRTDESGLTCAQRWQQAGFPGLKNDERVMFRGKMGVRVALLEVRRVIDNYRTEAVDLLADDDRTILLCDSGLASNAARFAPFLTWIYPLPNYWRLHGSAIVLPDISGIEPREMVAAISTHLGGPSDGEGVRHWLWENFTRFNESLTAAGLARRQQMFAGLDVKFGKAVYELRRPFAECRKMLDAASAVVDSELAPGERNEGFAEAREWLGDNKNPASTAVEGSEPLMGRVLLGQSNWRIEAMGGARFDRLRQEFEKLMGDAVRFMSAGQDDIAAAMRMKDPSYDKALIPPRLLENPEQIAIGTSRVSKPPMGDSGEMIENIHTAHARRWMDESVPALDGATPRQAARDAKLRPKLVRLMKSRIRATDEQNFREGTEIDVNWMVRELGLDEILFDAPPFREPPGFDEDEDDDWNDEGAADALPEKNPRRADVFLPPSPPLPNRPFTREEVMHKLDEAANLMKTSTDIELGMGSRGDALMDAVDEITVDLLSDNGFFIMMPMAVQVWHAFAQGTLGPVIDRGRLVEGIEMEIAAFVGALESGTPEQFERHIRSGPQLHLSEAIVAQVLLITETIPKKERPPKQDEPTMMAVLRAVITELDTASRGK